MSWQQRSRGMMPSKNRNRKSWQDDPKLLAKHRAKRKIRTKIARASRKRNRK